MKVAVVANPHFSVPPKKYGGAENVIYYLIKGLQELGHEPILVGTGDSEVDCEVIPIVDKARPYPRRAIYSPVYQQELKRIERRTKRILEKLEGEVDIIHSHGYDMRSFQNFPNVTTLHNMIEFEDIDYYIARKDMPYVSISDNQQGAYPYLNYVKTVYNGEDPSEFPIVTSPEKYLCFLGRFEREKAPHMAIQLALSVGMRIKLAGKLDYHGNTYFRDEIRQYLNHPLVTYLGEVGFNEKVKLVSKAACNLHPLGWREPFGLTVLEAAYCGTPTLAISRGSMPEVIEDGKTGVLVEDFIEGHHRLQECLNMDRQHIADHSRKKFNYLKMSKDYVHAYRRIIKSYR